MYILFGYMDPWPYLAVNTSPSSISVSLRFPTGVSSVMDIAIWEFGFRTINPGNNSLNRVLGPIIL